MTGEASNRERLAGAGVRLAVIAPDPESYLAPVRARFPGLAIAAAETAAEVARLGREFAPEIALVGRGGPNAAPRKAIFEMPGLRWIQVSGAGVEHLPAWDPARITVTNAAGLAADVMAQFAVGAIIAFASRIVPYLRQQIAREWRQRHVESIRGKTVIVVGLGQIGRAVAEKAVLLGMRVVGVRARPRPEPGVALVVGPERLHEALAEGDVVVVACPLTPKTRGLMGRSEFQAMKRGALLVNLARGGVIDEPALIAALESGRLGGAALDVFEQEPLPAVSPFWGMENVLITPHCISDVADWKREAGELFCRNLELWLAGRPLFNVVEPGRGY